MYKLTTKVIFAILAFTMSTHAFSHYSSEHINGVMHIIPEWSLLDAALLVVMLVVAVRYFYRAISEQGISKWVNL